MADNKHPESALVALRDVLGGSLGESELKKLLERAGNNVGAALNLHYDQLAQSDAPKRAAPSAALDSWRKAPKVEVPSGKETDTRDASSEKAKASDDLPERSAALTAAPLAERMRPKQIGDLLGQEDALGPVLRQAVQEDHLHRLPSLILWGPPGCGKTSFAHCVAAATRRAFRCLSAAKAGVAELREELSRAAGNSKLRQLGTILFVDEFHRWSKAQQDALLLDCEKGTITLIAATTENPSFSINNAILSRCRLVVFGKLSMDAVGCVIDRAMRDDVVLAGSTITPDARRLLASAADGDARVALNSLEIAARMTQSGSPVDTEAVAAAIQQRALYDRNGDFHYDLISALHKSMRGGCVDASLYYATRMLTAGEEPRYVTRRLIRFASEDVGLADPQALSQAVAADQAVHAIGMPEAGVVIAQCVVYLSLAPKSCAVYRAYEAAREACQKEPHAPVPLHIRNAPTKMMKCAGLGFSRTIGVCKPSLFRIRQLGTAQTEGLRYLHCQPFLNDLNACSGHWATEMVTCTTHQRGTQEAAPKDIFRPSLRTASSLQRMIASLGIIFIFASRPSRRRLLKTAGASLERCMVQLPKRVMKQLQSRGCKSSEPAAFSMGSAWISICICVEKPQTTHLRNTEPQV